MKKIILVSAVVILVLVVSMLLPFFIKTYGRESAEHWTSEDSYSIKNVQTVQMNENEDFRILVLSDIQLNVPFPWRNKKAMEMVESLVLEQNPDLVITTGDNVSFVFQGFLAKRFARKMESLDVKWAVVMGNHDGEASVDRNWHGNLYESSKNSLFEMGPVEVTGTGNYQINIADSNGEIIRSLIMLDSHAKTRYETGRDYDYIKPSQLEWYRWVTDGMEKETGHVVPSILFFHIPLIEFQEAIDSENVVLLDGEMNEDVYCAPISSGLFELVLEQGSTSHIFNGHDHVNNLSVLYKGITMTYGTKTGPCSYYDKDLQGGTLITIKSGTNEIEVEHIYD